METGRNNGGTVDSGRTVASRNSGGPGMWLTFMRLKNLSLPFWNVLNHLAGRDFEPHVNLGDFHEAQKLVSTVLERSESVGRKKF